MYTEYEWAQESHCGHGKTVRFEGRVLDREFARQHGFKLDSLVDQVVVGVVGLDSEGRVTNYVPVVFSEADLKLAGEDYQSFKSLKRDAADLVTQVIGLTE